MSRILVMVGTRKGTFFLWSDEKRQDWTVQGPLLKGWEGSCLEIDQRGETVIYAGLGHFVYGPSIHVSHDLGESWEQLAEAPGYAADSGRKLDQIWTIVPGPPSEPELLYAGVAEAGLFRSDDGGKSWQPVKGLNDHPTRTVWSPGAGGLCCHTFVLDPMNPKRQWVGISAVGTFRSDDGGESWKIKNEGVPIVVPSQEFTEVGSCVHRLVVDPGQPDTLFQQNHRGVFRSQNGGDAWERIEEGLPSSFGFPMVMHPHDPKTLFVCPLESDEYRFAAEGKLAIYRSRNGGDSWQPVHDGLPTSPHYVAVLRHAMATDDLEEAGIYFGTTGGQVFYSRDSGDSWQQMPCQLPRVLSIKAVHLS